MKKYPEYKGLNLPQIDKDILKFWEANKVFEQSVDNRAGADSFVFYEGPPSANGMPGIHHVMSRTIKDLFCRYKTLKGYKVDRKGGWDTHGLPVELGVEKALGITKEDIGTKISVAEYNQKCREDVLKFKDHWDKLTREMGYWVDLEKPYVTFERDYMETLWWILKELYKKGYLYKGYTIQPYSPAAGTGLSSHELNLPGCYRNVKDVTATAQFKVERGDKSGFLFDGDEEVFILAWTTTPWTLPSNVALAVGEKITYVKVKTFNPYTNEPISVLLAKDLLGSYFKPENSELGLEDYKPGDKQIPYKVVAEYTGQQLEGVRYEQLLPFVTPEGDAFRVIIGDYVSTEDGTGIVHIAPNFGADDARVAKAAGIGNVSLIVDKQGRFTDEVKEFAKEYVKAEYYTEAELEQELKRQQEKYKDVIPNLNNYLSVDEQITLKLKLGNRAFKIEKYEHNYPHCWRTDKPILYYPLDSWFIKTTAVKERMMELNKTINWKPESTGTGRFGNWLENLVDWNLSRSRYWGTPLPIWRTEDGEEEKCVGSVEELREEANKAVAAGLMTEALPEDFDLHKPYVDDVVLVSDSGKPMRREPDLIDVWFDSGAMPYAQWHYPFENKEVFENNFPADFIAEGMDQTRGWFFTLHAIGVLLKDSVAYKNVVSNGLLLDKNGNKMSKRLGNTVDPFETLSQYGADATRWYIISNSQPWDNLKFDLAGIQEVQRKFFGTLYNTYSFFSLYANVDGFVLNEQNTVPVAKRPEIDRWVLAKLYDLRNQVDAFYNDYEPTKATRAIMTFVDEHLSNWYVRLCRKRFWRGELNEDKQAAYETLFECLLVTAQLMSPVAPFFGDWLYQNLTNNLREAGNTNYTQPSVHLTDFPAAKDELLDESLLESMDIAQTASSLVLSLRKKEMIKVRQPLQKVLVPVTDTHFEEQFRKVESLVKSEVNVKEIEYVTDASGIIKKKIKPNFAVLGKKLGPKMRAVSQAVGNFTQDDIRQIERTGSYELNIDGEVLNLGLDEVEITSEDIPGWLVAGKDYLTVALDITITDELRDEGNAREFVNRIQNLRKDSDFNVTDRITLAVESHQEINSALLNYKDYICSEVLAENLSVVESVSNGTVIDINGVDVNVEIAKN